MMQPPRNERMMNKITVYEVSWGKWWLPCPEPEPETFVRWPEAGG